MTGMDEDPSRPLVLVNGRASRLHDEDARAAIVGKIVQAVRARTAQAPRVVDGDLRAASAALERLTDPPLVVVIGGDGTVRHAAATLNGSPIPLAIVPAGTGNVLAGTLGIRGFGPAVDAIRRGVPRRIDLGMAEWGQPGGTGADGHGVFLVAVGVGLDAKIMSAAQHEWKRRLGFGAYVGATLRELARLASCDFTITADDDTMEIHGHLALVANAGDIIPGRVGPREHIDPGDGQLDLLVVGGSGPLAGLRGATELLLRKGRLDGSVIRRPVRAVRIDAVPAQPVQTDGDHHPPGWLAARVVPGALTVLVPGR